MKTLLGGMVGDFGKAGAGSVVMPRSTWGYPGHAGTYAMQAEEEWLSSHYSSIAGFRYGIDRRHYHFFANGFTQESDDASGRVANDISFQRLPGITVKMPNAESDWIPLATAQPGSSQYNVVFNYGNQFKTWQDAHLGQGRWGCTTLWGVHHEPNSSNEIATFGGSVDACFAAYRGAVQRIWEILVNDCGVRVAQLDQYGRVQPGGEGFILYTALVQGQTSGHSQDAGIFWPLNGSWAWGDQHMVALGNDAYNQPVQFKRFSYIQQGFKTYCDQRMAIQDSHGRPFLPVIGEIGCLEASGYTGVHTSWTATGLAATKPNWEMDTANWIVPNWPRLWAFNYFDSQGDPSQPNWCLDSTQTALDSWATFCGRTDVFALYPQAPAGGPTITSFTPAGGPVGASVTILGSNFTGATSVKFNGIASPFTIQTSGQIATTVPVGATDGLIAVTTPTGTAVSSLIFNVGFVTGGFQTGVVSLATRLRIMAGTKPTVIIPPPPPPPPPPTTSALSEVPEDAADHYASFWAATNAQTLQSGRSGGCFGDVVKCSGYYWIGGYMDKVVDKARTTTYDRYGLYRINATTLDIDPSFNANLTPTGYGGGRVWDLATGGSNLVVAVGAFTGAAGVARNHIAVFNGASGSLATMFSGWTFNGDIKAVELVGTDMYLAGDFTSITPAGGVATTRTRLAKINNWDSTPTLNTAWTPSISNSHATYQLHHIVDSGNDRMLVTHQHTGVTAGVTGEGHALGLTTGDTAYWYFDTTLSISSVSVDDRTQQMIVGCRSEGPDLGNAAQIFDYGGSAGLINSTHYFHTDGDVQMTGTYKLSTETDPMLIAGGHGQFSAATPDTPGTSIPCNGLFALNAADCTLRTDFQPFFLRMPQAGQPIQNQGGVLKTWGSYSDEAVLDVDNVIVDGGLFFVLGDFTQVTTHDSTVSRSPRRRIAIHRELVG